MNERVSIRMLGHILRAVLAAALLAALAASPAAAHDPAQHHPQELPFAETLISGDLTSPFGVAGPQDCVDGQAGIYPCKDVDLKSFLPLPVLGGASGNDIWGWTDPETGREYAIMGTSTSTGFVDVTNPEDPKLVGTLPTRGTPDYVLWRDIKVDGNYAFIVSEVSGSGLQVFDLTQLRDAGDTPQLFTSTATYDEFNYAHNISINEETDYAYVVGSNDCAENGERGGLHMVDISDPLNPKKAGCATVGTFSEGGTEPDNYVHDVECVSYDGPDRDYRKREVCFGSNENVVAIYDVTDKAAPRVISTVGYPQASYTHQGALTEDKEFFLFGDELDEQSNGQNTTTYILDVSDLDAPPTPKAFEHPSKSIDHNMYTEGGRAYQSNYTEGLRILDYDDESLAAGRLDEIAFFDVVPGVDVAEFAGTWSNYRFPGSGTVVVSTIENEVSGLFVLDPTIAEKCEESGASGRCKKGGPRAAS